MLVLSWYILKSTADDYRGSICGDLKSIYKCFWLIRSECEKRKEHIVFKLTIDNSTTYLPWFKPNEQGEMECNFTGVPK
jgi:hypothetical protein